jgi:3,4-dihydroxy 2-butanone 4-phosphate synthase/GTP cyclohydrolase II
MDDLSLRFSSFSESCLGVLCDDSGDNRSVLIAPAESVTEQSINSILHSTGGLTFVALSPERAAALMLSPMQRRNFSTSESLSNLFSAQYTSVEAREGVSTGISAADRATTIRLLGAKSPQPRALVKPGHIFPVQTKRGGTLVRAALPEAALDIVTRAGFTDAALFVDLLTSDGELMTKERAQQWATNQGLPYFCISEIVRDRLVREPLVTRLAEALIPTKSAGEFRMIAYRSTIHDVEHVALVKGTLTNDTPTLVRVQVEHTIADVFGGDAPASRHQIHNALNAISERGSGVLLYLRKKMLHEDLAFTPSKISSDAQDSRSAASMREYGVGAQIIRDLGITKIDLLSSSNRTLVGLANFGITVCSQTPIPDNSQQKQEYIQ